MYSTFFFLQINELTIVLKKSKNPRKFRGFPRIRESARIFQILACGADAEIRMDPRGFLGIRGFAEIRAGAGLFRVVLRVRSFLGTLGISKM